MPFGAKASNSSRVRSNARISQYTPASRTRRAISWAYCAPKSSTRMRSLWISLDTNGRSEAVG